MSRSIKATTNVEFDAPKPTGELHVVEMVEALDQGDTIHTLCLLGCVGQGSTPNAAARALRYALANDIRGEVVRA